MTNVFISHSEEDSGPAMCLARAIERHDHSTWFYERDAIPGISHLIQCGDAIREARTFLILITDHSLASHEVAKELNKAHNERVPIIPVRIGVTDREFRERRREWDVAIGASVSIEMSRTDPLGILDKLLVALQRMDVAPDRPNGRAGEELSVPASRRFERKWPSDANQIQIHDLKRIVFANGLIEDFLQSESKYFLSANKGLGKTLLLTYKRSILAESECKGSGIFIPEGRPYLDFMSDLPSIRRQNESFLEDLVNSKRLWSFALRVSTLSYHSIIDREDPALTQFPSRARGWLTGSRIQPTLVFKEMLDHTRSEINRILDRTQTFLEERFNRIHGNTYVFIDKVDQGTRGLSPSAWILVQAGLIEAAWDLLNANNHVKIFASIRQESFSNYESDIKTNLYGATAILRYSNEELVQMLDRLSACYEEGKSFKEFIGLNVVKHRSRAFPEDSFRFMHRHTLGRPRDLVILASRFSQLSSAPSQPTYCDAVRDTSATVLIPNVFSEMRVFLKSLSAREDRLRFLSLIPHNILSRAQAEQIWSAFNRIEMAEYSSDFLSNDSFEHPFWELYSAGLLGVVHRDLDSHRAVQRFKQPHDMIAESQSSLPNVDYYLLHPALSGFVRSHRPKADYHVFRNIIVGNDCPWESYFGWLWNVERELFAVANHDLQQEASRLLEDVTVMLSAGKKEQAREEVRTSEDWRALKDRLVENGHDEARLWFDEIAAL